MKALLVLQCGPVGENLTSLTDEHQNVSLGLFFARPILRD